MRNKLFLLALLLALTLSGCGLDPSSSESLPSSEEATTEIVSSETSSISIIDFPKEDYVNEGTCGGVLGDIEIGRYLAENTNYECTFSSSHASGYTYRTSDTVVAEVVKSAASASAFTIRAHAPGDFILSIYDSGEMLVYRNLVHVRKAYAPEEIPQVLYDNDVYKSLEVLSSYRMVFTSVNPLLGTLRGTDDVETTEITIEFSAVYDYFIADFDAYHFAVTVDDITPGSQTDFVSFIVSRTGEFIVAYYDAGGGYGESLLAMLFPLNA